jgi:hypothetical protein
MISLDEFFWNERKENELIYISSDDIVSVNFDREKIGRDEVLLYFFSELLKYCTYQKLGVTLTG